MLTVDVVLPTPPFWLATTKTRLARAGDPLALDALPHQHRVVRCLCQGSLVVVEARIELGEVRSGPDRESGFT